jgi:hypothetical protein
MQKTHRLTSYVPALPVDSWTVLLEYHHMMLQRMW